MRSRPAKTLVCALIGFHSHVGPPAGNKGPAVPVAAAKPSEESSVVGEEASKPPAAAEADRPAAPAPVKCAHTPQHILLHRLLLESHALIVRHSFLARRAFRLAPGPPNAQPPAPSPAPPGQKRSYVELLKQSQPTPAPAPPPPAPLPAVSVPRPPALQHSDSLGRDADLVRPHTALLQVQAPVTCVLRAGPPQQLAQQGFMVTQHQKRRVQRGIPSSELQPQDLLRACTF